jgi:hypothetical protein
VSFEYQATLQGTPLKAQIINVHFLPGSESL